MVSLISKSFKRKRIENVSLIVLCECFLGTATYGLSLFLPLIRADLEIDFSQAGLLFAVNTLTYALMQISAGYLGDRYGAKRCLVIGMMGTTVLSLQFGLVTGFGQAILNRGLSGIFQALLFAPAITLLSDWFAGERRATAMSMFLIGPQLGYFIISVVGPILVNHSSWRVPFFIFSPVGISLGVAFWFWGKGSPTTRERHGASVLEVMRLLRYRVVWICASLQYVRMAIMQGIAMWLPTLLVDEKGLSLQIAGLLVALRTVIIVPSGIVGSHISDRLNRPAAIIGASLFALMVSTALLVMVNNFVLLVIVIAVNAIFVQMYFGSLFAIPVKVFGNRAAGTLTGFGNLFANLGGVSFTYLLGLLRDATGSFLSGFMCIAFICIIGLAATTLLVITSTNLIPKT